MANRLTTRGGWALLTSRIQALRAPARGAVLRAPARDVSEHPAEPLAVESVLTGVAVDGDVAELAGRVSTRAGTDTLHGVRAWLRLRDTQQAVEVPVRLRGTRSTDAGRSLAFTVAVDPRSLPARGSWDLEIAPVWEHGSAPATGFGAARPGRVDADGQVLASGDVLDFTAPGGHASLARGVREVPRVTAERLQEDDDGRPEVVLCVPADDDLRVYADVTPAGSRDARQRLPWRRLDDGTVAVRLPVPHRAGALRSRLVVVADGIRVRPRLDGLDGLDGTEGLEGQGDDDATVRLEGDTLTVTRYADAARGVPA
ncbi:hypothetical protein GCM10009809_03360 [Isoptericola hypogeus]|uniref:Uncharacterized protein n=1 Tax=Isoptericola hypogeus TaxID=300179 RepID=A0ABN2IRN0_9MICO